MILSNSALCFRVAGRAGARDSSSRGLQKDADMIWLRLIDAEERPVLVNMNSVLWILPVAGDRGGSRLVVAAPTERGSGTRSIVVKETMDELERLVSAQSP
jgi:hypothetical protein